MATTQRTSRRRSARLSYGDEEATISSKASDMPPAKRPRRTSRDTGRTIDGKGVTVAKKQKAGRRFDIAVGVPALTDMPASYDEEDDGFAFTRTRSKNAKTAAVVQDEERVEKPAPRRKKSFSTPLRVQKDAAIPTRRTRNSGGASRTERSRGKEIARAEALAPQHDDEDGLALVGHDQAVVTSKDTTTIALPFSDTPIIKRNKEFRQHRSTSRRSSIGLRGRRASSLIENGSNALPHHEVEATEFYKHIAGDGLPEPRRMKQLLTWCATRALGDKPSYSSEDGNARLAARVIQEELLRDFSNRSEMSDWFSREECSTPPVMSTKPNPRNIASAAKVVELEKQVQRLQEEKDAWEALSRIPVMDPPPPVPPESLPALDSIDSTLLDPEQAAILSTLKAAPDLVDNTESRLKAIASSLEFKIDRFATGVHQLGQYQTTAERVADRIVGVAGQQLQRRETAALERAGTRDLPMQEVLRSLAELKKG